MEKENLAMAAVEQHNQYKLELYAGDPITIRTSILEVDDKSIRMLHELTNDETGCVAATSEIIGLQLDATSRRPCSIAGDVRNRLFMKMASGAKQDELPS
jgi:acyl-CoA thioester hydrolase